MEGQDTRPVAGTGLSGLLQRQPVRVFATTAAAVVPDLTDVLAIFQLRYPDEADAGTGVLYASRVRTALAKGVALLGPISENFALGALSRDTIDRRKTQMITFPPGRPPGLVSDASAAWMARAQATSLALIPIVIDGRTAALAAASSCLGNPPPAQIELGLLEEVLRSVEEPLRRTLELQSLRSAALTLQRSFLITPPQIRGGELAPSTTPPAPRPRSAATGTTPPSCPTAPSPCPSATSQDTTSGPLRR